MNTEQTNQTQTARFWKNSAVVILAAILCNCLWGSAIPAIKIGYRLFSITDSISQKFLFAGIRFILAGLLVLIGYMLLYRKIPLIQKKNTKALLELAFVQTTVQYIFFYIGVANCEAANGSIVNSCTTFISVVLAHFIYRNDRLNARKVLGCLVGFGGVLLVTLTGSSNASAHVSFLGEGFVLIAAFAFSLSGVMSKKLTQEENSMVVTGYNLFLGGVLLTLLGIVSGARFSEISTAGILVLLYLAVLSAVAFAIWTILLKYNKIGRICIYNFVVPVSGIFLAGLILGEDIWHLRYFIALALVCAGIVMVNRSGREKTDVV